MYGDLPADPGGGTGGGAISDKCSGDIEPFSESSVLAVECEELVSLPTCGWAGSSISPRAPSAGEGITVVALFLPLFGLTMGDCRTTRVLRGFGGTFLLDFLARIVELDGADCESRFMSIGEFVVPEQRGS